MNETPRQQILKRPRSIEETGLTMSLLGELALKLIYNADEIAAGEISRQLHLPFANVVQPVLEMLKRQQLINVIGVAGVGERAYRYTIFSKGIERVHEALERNQYVAPAPVPLERYNAMTRAQAVGEVLFDEAAVAAAFEGLVVNRAMLDKIGAAVNSGKSIFLYGPPGDGKTTAATRIARLLAREPIYIPYAVSVDGHIIRVYDELNHSPFDREPSPGEGGEEFGLGKTALDERWVLVERPAVMVGGELALESLNLIWDPALKYYEAPFQMKANGGMFLIDDFGRQQIDPQDLLNRWMVPLETRVDFLTLHTGKKIEIPFEQLVVFATNLEPADLVDDAFLRRIRHKIKVANPTAEEFHQVFQNACEARGVEYTREGFMHLVREWYVKPQRDFRNCHPRDIVDELLDIARYKRLRPLATPEMIDRACSAYFADL